VQEEEHDLEQLYGQARKEQPVQDVLKEVVKGLVTQPHLLQQPGQQQQEPDAQQQRPVQPTVQHLDPTQQAHDSLPQIPPLLSKLYERGTFLGSGHSVVTSMNGPNEECERELQREEEKEAVIERQVMLMSFCYFGIKLLANGRRCADLRT
jgi:hypothetical protein